MTELNLRQKTILSVLGAHEKETLLSYLQDGMDLEEFELCLSDYAGEKYIPEDRWLAEGGAENYFIKVSKPKKIPPKPTPKSSASVTTSPSVRKVAKNDFETAKQLLSFQTVATRYSLFLEPGTNGWQNCCCPLPGHDDSSPSFGINFETNSFNCFGCNEKGDVLKFISLMENKSIVEVTKEILDENKTPTTEIELEEMSDELLLQTLNQLSTTTDGQFELLQAETAKLASEVGRKITLLTKKDINQYQNIFAQTGIVLGGYQLLFSQAQSGVYNTREWRKIHAWLEKLNQKIKTK